MNDVLAEKEKTHLLAACAAFGIQVASVNPGMLKITVQDPACLREFEVPRDQATARMVSELCSKMAPWVAFKLGACPIKTVASMDMVKIRRVAELYRLSNGLEQRKKVGRPKKSVRDE
mgnify:CR=1 FL=1